MFLILLKIKLNNSIAIQLFMQKSVEGKGWYIWLKRVNQVVVHKDGHIQSIASLLCEYHVYIELKFNSYKCPAHSYFLYLFLLTDSNMSFSRGRGKEQCIGAVNKSAWEF